MPIVLLSSATPTPSYPFRWKRSSADAAQALAEKTGATTLQADSADRVAVSKVIADQGPLDILVVNSVQPGPVNTDLNPEDGPMKDLMHSFMAIKRHAQPEEIAGMVAYLVGPEASIVTGAQHTIDGGFGA